MRVIEWEIKVTKFCNLRCTYCYEFDELSGQTTHLAPTAGAPF